MAKPELKKQAIKLRKNGKSYSEILEDVPVAKSTLSRWLQDVDLSKSQEQRLSEKKKVGQKRAAEAVRQKRIEKTKRIKKKAQEEIGKISERELWLVGIALYWAEGTKGKPYRTSVRTEFSNSDNQMIALYVKWLREIVEVGKEEFWCAIYIHENHKDRIDEVKEHWIEATGLPEDVFGYTYYKKHNPQTIRKNTGDSYYGTLQIYVQASTDLRRKIEGWIEGVIDKTI